MSKIEDELERQLTILSVTGWEREYRFAAEHIGTHGGVRKRLKAAGLKDWRIDFAFPDVMLAVECEGGGWTNGRHTRGTGFAGDLRKYHHACMLGWYVYRCDGEMVRTGMAADFIVQYLRQSSTSP